MNLTEEQRRKINQFIAEKRGWKSPDHPDTKAQTDGWSMPEKWWLDPTGELQFRHNIPDYTRSLDACHEAEKLVPDKYLLRRFLYLQVLDDPENTQNEPAWATAEQRALALFQTLGGVL
jgi:hypothetical protein